MNFDALNQFSLNQLGQFHFIRPEWLWALVVLVVIWLLIGTLRSSTHWESFIAKDKLEALRVTGGRYSQAWRWLLIVGWVIGTLAAAGPAWKQVPVPTVRDESAMVIVLDLSRSMLAQDIAPDRLTRTKYKLIDILRLRGDGQTALVAYAGDPHTVSPLTDDPRTIEALLPALHPSIMPVQGSNTEAAIDLALQLLKDAGLSQGEILLLTDGVAPEAQRHIRDKMNGTFRLSILGIGSTDAVPIPIQGGGFYQDSRGEIILTKLNRDELQILAGVSSGRYVELQSDDSDIQYLLKDEFNAEEFSDEQENALLYDSWEDMGYWLILILLPFVALSFRKGAIYVLPLIFLLPNDSQALSWEEAWDDLWLTKDQQAVKLLDQGKAAEAASLFERSDWAGMADFEAENYQSAADKFATGTDISNLYNKGNALAFQGDLEAALDAYNEVLEQKPEHEDAAYNKSVIEQLMQQQQEQQDQEQSESSEDQQGENKENQEQQDSEGQESSEQQENQSQEQQGQDSQEGSEQQSQEQQNSEQNQSSEQESQSEEEQAAQQEKSEEEQTEEEKAAQQHQESEEEAESEQEQQAAMMPAEPTPDALEDSSEQWLRAIPDDPSGLLRRKFDYESRQNQLEQRYRLQLPTNPDDERY